MVYCGVEFVSQASREVQQSRVNLERGLLRACTQLSGNVQRKQAKLANSGNGEQLIFGAVGNSTMHGYPIVSELRIARPVGFKAATALSRHILLAVFMSHLRRQLVRRGRRRYLPRNRGRRWRGLVLRQHGALHGPGGSSGDRAHPR